MAVNSFAVLPLVSIFMVYAFGRAVIVWEWKLFFISFVFFVIAVFVEIALGAIDA